MAESTNKEELATQLAISRAKMSLGLGGLRKNLAVGNHLKRSVAQNRIAWVSGAIVIGFLLSRTPARRAKAVKFQVRSPRIKPEKQSIQAALLLAGLKIAVDLIKPVLLAAVKSHLGKQFSTAPGFHVPPKKPATHPPAD